MANLGLGMLKIITFSILVSASLFFIGCAETDPCEKINKSSDCLEYNNCNVLESWRLQRIQYDHACSSKFTTNTLFQDNLVVFKDGSLELRMDNKLSPLDRWEFEECGKLKLYSSKSDSTFTFTIDEMDDNKMIWSYEYTDSCKVKASIHFDRM